MIKSLKVLRFATDVDVRILKHLETVTCASAHSRRFSVNRISEIGWNGHVREKAGESPAICISRVNIP